MNFPILKYNLMRSGRITPILCAHRLHFFSYHACLTLLWPTMLNFFSDFLQHLRESWKWPLSLINISMQQANHSKIFFRLNFFLIEAENRAECLKDWFSPFPDFPVLTYNCLVTGTIIHFPFEIDTQPVSIVISILLLQFIPSLRLFCPCFKSFNDFLRLCPRMCEWWW